MAFVFTVEDGTGVEDANAYLSLADALDYHAGRGQDTAWAAFTDPEKQDAIVKATDHIEQNFADWFIGVRASSEQGLSWPRLGAWDRQRAVFLDDQVPVAVKNACAEYALLSLQESSLAATPAVISESKSIDGVAKSVTYAAPTVTTSTNLAIANRLMRPVLAPASAVRA